MTFLRILKRILVNLYKLNIAKTIYINFRVLPFTTAIKFPIFVFNKLKIYSLSGEICIDGPVRLGMIQIGKDLDHNPVSLCPVKLNVIGKLTFKGYALISGGTTLTVWGGDIVLGDRVSLGSGVQLKAYNKIEIGTMSQVVALSTIMDTNVHYIKNIKTGAIYKNSSPIYVGKYCWLNQSTVVMKGTKIPDYVITARGTLMSGDYTGEGKSFTLYGGTPAKVLKTDVQRIFDYEYEKKLNNMFSKRVNDHVQVDEGIFYEPNNLPNIFKL